MTDTSKGSLPLPTVKQVVDAASAIGIEAQPQQTTSNVNTSAGQTSIPSVVGSQPSSNKPIATQMQATQVESVPLDELFTRPMTEDEILRSPLIQARSFNYSGDEIKVLPINHNYTLRWIQCGDYKGAGTNWLAKQVARGFTYATVADLQDAYKEKFKADATGHLVIPPDLVLMKIQTSLYYGYLKGNMEESLDRISDKGALTRAQKVAAAQMRAETLPGDLGKNDSNNNRVPNFNNNLGHDKAAFYDPTAGR